MAESSAVPDPAVAHTEAGTSPIGAPRQLLFTGGIVLVFVLLLAALVNTVSGLGLPFAGYTLTAAYTVDDNPAPGAPALGGPSAGDRILRMDGQLPAEMRAVFGAAARTGRPVEYVTQHRLPDGTRVPGTAQGGVTVFRLSHWLQIYLPGLLLGGIWWALGTFLYFVGRERRVHQIFLVVSLIISSLVLTDLSTIYTYQETPLAATVFQPLYALLLPLAGASMIQLALFFPVPKRLVVAHPRWHYGVYLLALLIGSANMITRLLRAQETARGLVPPPDTLATVWSSLAGLFTVAGLLVLIGGLLYDRLRARDRVVRRQVALVGLGALLGAGPLVLGELLPLALGQRTVITTQQGYLFLILAPLALAYAIVRYRLFDVTRVLQLGAVYLVASSILLGLYFLLVSGLQALLRELTGQQSDIVALISTLGIAVLFAPLIARAQFYAERVLFRERFLLRQALRDFGARVATLYELDPLAGALVEETSRLLRVP
ncbi:MAG TPA: hypothetical protein VKY74_20500, partial [Chloroflexia bacterium]|nr:hypothetical protein [Chloroflexia bacterium]